ncbi:MAG: transglycosylase domain-containing protein [Mycobacteriales bacterium]
MVLIRRSGALAARVGLALLVCLVAGLLVAGMALPLVGGTGLVAKKGIDSFDDAKDLDAVLGQLVNLRLGERSRIVAADGTLLAEVLAAEDRTLTTINRVPDVMVHALLAIEDSRFYQHRGVDLKGIIRAAIQNKRAGRTEQGASTLTQQYVKNALLTIATTPEEKKAATEQTPSRKIREARLAMEMERRFTKDEILERYLNIAYFGNGSYGVRTAAQYYFKTAVDKLTLPQAALLAGLVQSPSRWDPRKNYDAALTRRNVVLSKMAEEFPCDATATTAPVALPDAPDANAGAATCYSDLATAAKEQPLNLNIRKPPPASTSVAPYFLDYVQTYLLEHSTALGKTKDEREAAYFRGGLTIRTTLDQKIQAAAQAALESTDIKDKEPSTAIVVIEPGTGKIRAMAVNTKPAGERSLNLATGGQAGMQAGSTFKTFVLAAALQQGMPLGTTFQCPAKYTSPLFEKTKGVPYEVANSSESEDGTFNLITGTALSVNTCFLQIEEKTGIAPAVEIARKMMGPKPSKPLPKKDEKNASFVLGTSQTSVLDVANAYATIAARGVACEALGVEEVYNAARERYPVVKSNCSQVLSQKVADTMAFILRNVIDGEYPRTGFRASIGRPAAGKTGTAQDYASAFFAGFTPDYAAAVWMGHSSAPNSAEGKLLNIQGVSGPPVEKVYGGTFPAEIWQKTMTAIHEGKPVRNFVDPPPDVFIGTEIDVPSLGGKPLAEAQKTLEGLGLSGVVAPRQVGSAFPAGTVAYTDPGRGRKTQIGSSVTIFVSNGIAPPPPPPAACVPTPEVPCPTTPPCVATPTAPCPTPPPASSPAPSPPAGSASSAPAPPAPSPPGEPTATPSADPPPGKKK